MLRRGPELALCRQHGLVDAGPWRRHCDRYDHLQPRLLWPGRHLRALPRGLLLKHHWRDGVLAVPRGYLRQRRGAGLSCCGVLWVVRSRKLLGAGLHHVHFLPLLGRLLLSHAVYKHVPNSMPAGPLLHRWAGLGHCKPVPLGVLFGWWLNVHGADNLRSLHCRLLLWHGQHCHNG